MERNIENFNKLIEALENGVHYDATISNAGEAPVFFFMGKWFEHMGGGVMRNRRFLLGDDFEPEKVLGTPSEEPPLTAAAAKEAEKRNTERLRAVDHVFADRLNDCGTCACIRGHMQIVFEEEMTKREGAIVARTGYAIAHARTQAAADILGISYGLASELFIPAVQDMNRITRQMAINALKELRDTGSFDWDWIIAEAKKEHKTGGISV